MGYLVATSFWIFVVWLIRRDTKSRDGISAALWIPTLWAFILLSKPVSFWLGTGGGVDALEGSPVDRLFYFVIILLALLTLARRNVHWSLFFQQNWPIFLLYGFFLVSVSWADSPFSSFKRWFKDLGNVFVAMVILTERNPMQAVRAVFIRCAYILFPLSVIFIRYFPELGRAYSRSGGLQIVGATTQKNNLGILVVVCGLVLLWDWLERGRENRGRGRLSRYFPLTLLVIGFYLLSLSDSQTSILCMLVGGMILLSIRLPMLRRRISAFGAYSLAAVAGFFLVDWLVGIKATILGTMGRDESLTGRTEVWRELLALKTDPVIGTGFLSFWSDQYYQSRLPYWVAFSAHNGYIEIYIDGGFAGLFFLGVLFLAIGWRVNHRLSTGDNYALLQFAVFWAALIGDYSESHFGRMTPLWFMLLLTALLVPRFSRAPVNHAPDQHATSSAQQPSAVLQFVRS